LTYLNESIDNASNHLHSPRLGEILEEDEGTMSSSSNPSRQNQNNGVSSLHESSSSSANTSDNDDDSPIGLSRTNANSCSIPEEISSGYVEVSSNKQTENSRVKGKNVERLRNESERENVS